jgi:hypothetical protein
VTVPKPAPAALKAGIGRLLSLCPSELKTPDCKAFRHGCQACPMCRRRDPAEESDA